ncbi:MAG TPA: hypothetical protein DCL54_08205 [Alphaproteobacteria bacterium]|nr:hypothetical protein [Alphaproteobacteria bacterium]
MKLLLDMNLPPALADRITELGIETVHWSGLGPPSAPDEDIMAVAAERGLVIVTYDMDFSAILAATRSGKPSVVQLRAISLEIDVLAPRLAAAVSQAAPALEAGALLTVDLVRSRVRLLPLKT